MSENKAIRGDKVAENVQFKYKGKNVKTLGSLWIIPDHEIISGKKDLRYAEIQDMWFALEENTLNLIDCGTDFPLMQGLPPKEEN